MYVHTYVPILGCCGSQLSISPPTAGCCRGARVQRDGRAGSGRRSRGDGSHQTMIYNKMCIYTLIDGLLLLLFCKCFRPQMCIANPVMYSSLPISIIIQQAMCQQSHEISSRRCCRTICCRCCCYSWKLLQQLHQIYMDWRFIQSSCTMLCNC